MRQCMTSDGRELCKPVKITSRCATGRFAPVLPVVSPKKLCQTVLTCFYPGVSIFLMNLDIVLEGGDLTRKHILVK